MQTKAKLMTAVLTVALLVPFISANAKVGVRVGTYTDAEELFIGGEYLAPIANHTYINPNIEYVFLENATYLTLNLDLHYDFVETERIFLWAGGGLGIQYLDFEGDDNSSTEAGLNLLLGLGLLTQGSFIPYIQGKAILGDFDDFVLGIGVRF